MRFKAFLLLTMFMPALSSAAPKCPKIKVAIIDTGLDLKDPRFKGFLCKRGHKNFVSDETIEDIHGHGTFVAGLIKQYAGNAKYCLLVYKYYSDDATSTQNLNREVLAFNEAIKNGASVVNYSGGGAGYSAEEAKAIKTHTETTFVVAAGNERENLDIPGNEYWPASLFYPNMHVVASIDAIGNRSSSSNYGKKIEDKEIGEDISSYLPDGKTGTMSGTSMSTAIFSGKLVDKLSNSCDNR